MIEHYDIQIRQVKIGDEVRFHATVSDTYGSDNIWAGAQSAVFSGPARTHTPDAAFKQLTEKIAVILFEQYLYDKETERQQ